MKPVNIRLWYQPVLVSARRLVRPVVWFAGLQIASVLVVAQTATPTASPAFAPGARELFSLDFAQEPLGQFPESLSRPTGTVGVLAGTMHVVEKSGTRMLRASYRSEFLITLNERLPQHFTLEFDLFTRPAGGPSEELAFEGTPTLNRGSASAHVHWSQGGMFIIGGGQDQSNSVSMPEEIGAVIQGDLAEIRIDVNGDAFKAYTNGRLLYDLPVLKIPRGRVLRVLLNALNPNEYSVHLAKLRIADAATTSPVTTQQQSASLASPGTRGSGTTTPPAITGLAVNLNSNGAAVVSWNPLPVPAEYFVVRWNVNDPTCCNAMSPPGTPLTSTMWQDVILPVRGTYAYRLIAKTASGTVEAQTTYAYGAAPTPTAPPLPTDIATIGSTTLPAPTAPSTTSTTPTTTSTATGVPSTGTILSPEPLPPPPYSSTPRTVSVMPTTTTTTATTTPTTTTIPSSTTTNPTLDTTATTTTPTTSTTTSVEPVMAVPAVTTATGMVSSPPARYRVLLTGLTVAQNTIDDILNIDGRGDEVLAAASVVVLDRNLRQMKSNAFVYTHEYGDVGASTRPPSRIQAGTISTAGGLTTGDRAPAGYEPLGSAIPAPTPDRFPLLLWEGELNAGVEAVVVMPSVWERDLIHSQFEGYKINWRNLSPSALMQLPAVTDQYANPAMTFAVIPLSALTVAAPPAAAFTGAPTDGYKLADLAIGPNSDRPLGMRSALGVLIYQERVAVVTREKVNQLSVNQGITLSIPFVEGPELFLRCNYILYLRVQRTQ